MSLVTTLIKNSIKNYLLPQSLLRTLSTNFSSQTYLSNAISNHNVKTSNNFLRITTVSNLNIQQVREYKKKIRLRKRCKSCYFVWRNGRLYVECEEHPRHKQHHVDSFLKGFDNISNGYVKGDVKC